MAMVAVALGTACPAFAQQSTQNFAPDDPMANGVPSTSRHPVQSQTGSSEIAYPATFENVMKAALKLNAFDLSNDKIIDDFAKVSYCQIYQANHLNEFTWRKVRAALREKIHQDLPTYPTTLFLDRIEEFTTYDFQTGRLQMDPKSIMRDVTEMRLTPFDKRNACDEHLDAMTQDFVVSLDQTLNINGVKLSDDEASAVVSGLVNDTRGDDVKRHGFGRYFVHLITEDSAPPGMKNTILFTGKIDRITFYEDDMYQKPFWSGVSSIPDYHTSTDAQDNILFKGVDVPTSQ